MARVGVAREPWACGARSEVGLGLLAVPATDVALASKDADDSRVEEETTLEVRSESSSSSLDRDTAELPAFRVEMWNSGSGGAEGVSRLTWLSEFACCGDERMSEEDRVVTLVRRDRE